MSNSSEIRRKNMTETEILNRNFEKLRIIFEDVLHTKNAGGDISDKRKYASLLFVSIKEMNRQVKYKLRNGRDDLHKEKVNIDNSRLQLQNLLYEVNHLKREIRHCHQFKSLDEDIELLSDYEYQALLAVNLPRSEPNKPRHEKRLERLECELKLRKQLSEEHSELIKSKKQMYQEIVQKIERLSSFAPSLRTLLKATQPLQEALQVPMESKWELEELVQYLPQPLYIIYMHIKAYALALQPDVSVTVVSIENEPQGNDGPATHSDLINVCASFDTRTETSSFHSSEEKRTLEPHPLMVKFSIGKDPLAEDWIAVCLRFFPYLGCVTATTEINIKETDSTFGEITLTQELLKYVVDNDMGTTIPVIGAEYELKKFDMTAEECLKHFDTNKWGKPYRWLQRMCDIEVDVQSKDKEADITLHNLIPDTIQAIRNLWFSRWNLIKQIRGFINKNTDLYLSEGQTPPSCSLVQWSSVTWEEYITNNATAQYIEEDLIQPSYIFFRAVVVRGSAKMECLIGISTKFPVESPLWVISISWNGQHNSENDPAIKQMEYWTNSIKQTAQSNEMKLLGTQLLRTMYSFDIFLETEAPLYSPIEYSREKHYIRAFSKRYRARPYRSIDGCAVNTFKQ